MLPGGFARRLEREPRRVKDDNEKVKIMLRETQAHMKRTLEESGMDELLEW